MEKKYIEKILKSLEWLEVIELQYVINKKNIFKINTETLTPVFFKNKSSGKDILAVTSLNGI